MRKADLKDFDQIFKIIEESFPKDEYRTREGQRNLFKDERYSVHVIEEDEDIISFIATWDLGIFVYAEHMAVTESGRNRGLGGAMIKESTEKAREKGKIFCLEVEPPQEAMAKRRISFYERMGFALNHYPYMQPALAEGQNEIPLMIMSYGKALSQEEFDNIKDVLYREVYKVK